MPLHPLTEADLELILPWRNAPAVRRAMYSHHAISLDEHRAWFQRLLQDPSRRWYLFREDSGTAQGVVYFTDIDPSQGTAFWGFYARPEAPAGTGLQILFAALDTAFGELALHKLSGEVLADNPRSLHLHQKVGFGEEGRFREQHRPVLARVPRPRADRRTAHRPGRGHAGAVPLVRRYLSNQCRTRPSADGRGDLLSAPSAAGQPVG